MRVVQYDRYGSEDELYLADQPEPTFAPGRHRVRVHWAALNPKDGLFMKGKFRLVSGRSFPKRCGLDFAGELLDPVHGDSEQKLWPAGTRVFGMLNEWHFCRGTLGEVVSVTPQEMTSLPEDLSLDAAAGTALVGVTSLQALRDHLSIGLGSRVLIHGASGGVGSMAIQIAKLMGAHITTRSGEHNISFCEELGAHTALDYNDEIAGSTQYDAVFDVFGNLEPSTYRPWLARRGRVVHTVPTGPRVLRELIARLGGRQERTMVVKSKRGDLTRLAKWLSSGELKPVIDSRVRLEDVAEAFRRLRSKRARGKILIQVVGT